MFGMGMGELIVIAIVALLFLGPEKLPEAAKTISRGIRDFRKQTRELQQIVEDDHEIGGAIRDLKSALRGEEPPSSVEERRRRASEAARLAADNAAQAAEQLTGQNAGSSDDETSQSPAADIPAADIPAADIPAADIPAADIPATESQGAPERDSLADHSPDPDAASPGASGGLSEPDMSFLRPAQGTVASTYQPGSRLFDAEEADRDTPDEPGVDDTREDPADEAHG